MNSQKICYFLRLTCIKCCLFYVQPNLEGWMVTKPNPIIHVITGLDTGGAEGVLANLVLQKTKQKKNPLVVSLVDGGFYSKTTVSRLSRYWFGYAARSTKLKCNTSPHKNSQE